MEQRIDMKSILDLLLSDEVKYIIKNGDVVTIYCNSIFGYKIDILAEGSREIEEFYKNAGWLRSEERYIVNLTKKFGLIEVVISLIKMEEI